MITYYLVENRKYDFFAMHNKRTKLNLAIREEEKRHD
jgi:hypothetical protein